MITDVMIFVLAAGCEMHERQPRTPSSTAMPPIVSKQQPSPSTTVSMTTGSTSQSPCHRGADPDRPIIVQPRAAGRLLNLDREANWGPPHDAAVNGWHNIDDENNCASDILNDAGNPSPGKNHRQRLHDGSGDAAGSGEDVDVVGMQSTSFELSGRREIVELLDAEPTFDYLVQNGVVTRDEVVEVVAKTEPSQQNHWLLRLIESRRDVAGVRLLTNVLRLTGQHYLANLLDDGTRIRILSGSGQFSKVL